MKLPPYARYLAAVNVVVILLVFFDAMILFPVKETRKFSHQGIEYTGRNRNRRSVQFLYTTTGERYRIPMSVDIDLPAETPVTLEKTAWLKRDLNLYFKTPKGPVKVGIGLFNGNRVMGIVYAVLLLISCNGLVNNLFFKMEEAIMITASILVFGISFIGYFILY